MAVWTATQRGWPSKLPFCAILFYASPRATKACETRLYGQALRLRRICSEDANLEKHLRDLERHFQARGYDSEAVKEGINRARVVPRSETLTPQQKETEGMNPLVVTYHPCLPPLKRTVGKHTPLLRTDHLQQAIPERHRVVYRRPKNLRDLLVWADVKPAHTPLGAKPNVVKWGTTRPKAARLAQPSAQRIQSNVTPLEKSTPCESQPRARQPMLFT